MAATIIGSGVVRNGLICELLLDSRRDPRAYPMRCSCRPCQGVFEGTVEQSEIHNDTGPKSVPFSWALKGFAASIEVTC